MIDRQNEKSGPEDSGAQAGPGNRAYSAAMEAVLAVPIAMGLGWWADSHFETAPIFLLTGLGFGFATLVVRLMRMREIVEEAAEEASEADPAEKIRRERERRP